MKFLVGNYTSLGGPGVALCGLENSALRLIDTNPAIGDPIYVILSADHKTVYASGSDENGGAVAAFDLSDGLLRFVSKQRTFGNAACHLTLSPDERYLYVANYVTGNLAVFPVDNANIGACIQLIQHEGSGPFPGRQESAHLHFVSFDPEDKLLYAVDLGMDAVMIYRQDPKTGLLSAQERINAEAGLGPRHLIFHGADLMYVAHELGNAVSAYKRTNAGWKLIHTLPTLPGDWQGESTVAAIRILNGRLYVSNRGHDSLAVYEITSSGALSPIGIYSTMGRTPRDFQLLPDGRILVAHQDSGDVSLLAFGANTGEQIEGLGLTQLCEPLPLPGAVSICPISE